MIENVTDILIPRSAFAKIIEKLYFKLNNI